MADSANVAHDQAIDRTGGSSFPPARMGAKAQSSLPTAVSADGDCVDLVATRQGQLRVYVDSMPTTTVTPSGNTTVVGAAADDAPVSGNPVLVAGRSDVISGTTPGRTPVNQSGDMATLLTDEYGRVRAVIDNSISGSLTGAAAHDAAISGAPVRIGARAQNALPSAVSADADVVDVVATQQGQVRAILDDSSSAVGHSVKYEASHAGGASEVTAKGSAGLLKWVNVSNPNTTDVWLQVHDATNPNVGTDVPLVAFLIPGGTGASNRAVFNQEFGPVGITFANAITYTVTTTAGGSTAPGSAVSVAMGYK